MRNFDKEFIFLNIIIFIFCLIGGGLDDIAPFFLLFFIWIFKVKKYSYLFVFQLLILFFSSIYIFVLELFRDFKIEYIGKLLYPIIFYYTGYVFVNKYKTVTYKILIFNISISLLLFCLLSMLYTVYLYGPYTEFYLTQGRILYGYLSDKIYSATLINGYLSLAMSMISIIFIKDIKLTKLEIFYILIAFTIAVYLGMSMANRSTLLLVLFPMIITLLFCFNQLNKIIFFTFSFLSILVVSYYSNNILLFQRLASDDGLDDSRTVNWLSGLNIISENPIGGSGLRTQSIFAHNFWIDLGISYGLMVMILFIIFTLLNSIIFIKFLLINKKNFFVLSFLLMFISINIIFLIEPVYQGLFKIYCLYCLLIGMGTAYLLKIDQYTPRGEFYGK